MYTPMQELIEQLKQEIENQVQFRDEFEDGVVQGLEGALDLAEAMLKKEKKVMEDCFDSANLIIEESIDGDHKWGTFREYYNETFNTKES